MAMIIWTVTHVNRITNTFKRISDRLNQANQSSPFPSNYSDRKYSIYGVCAHEGTMRFGHCISVCRQSAQGQASEEGCTRWYLCNDKIVLPQKDHSVIGNENAHILFYEAE